MCVVKFSVGSKSQSEMFVDAIRKTDAEVIE